MCVPRNNFIIQATTKILMMMMMMIMMHRITRPVVRPMQKSIGKWEIRQPVKL